MDNYKGFISLNVDDSLIEDLYLDNKILIPKITDDHIFYPNMYVELISLSNNKHTALGKIDETCKQIKKIDVKGVGNLKPKNREQVFAMDALQDKNISVVVLTGRSGSGKTLISMGSALEQINKKIYKKVILSRPMSEVGRYKLGSLPGFAGEKFSPYLSNYETNLEHLVGDKCSLQDLIEQNRFSIVPLQLIRGASFSNCFIIIDEAQVLGPHEILTIGTRVGPNSKLVILGDLQQRDENIKKENTGMYKFINSELAKMSPIVAIIELQRCERSKTAMLFSEIFDE